MPRQHLMNSPCPATNSSSLEWPAYLVLRSPDSFLPYKLPLCTSTENITWWVHHYSEIWVTRSLIKILPSYVIDSHRIWVFPKSPQGCLSISFCWWLISFIVQWFILGSSSDEGTLPDLITSLGKGQQAPGILRNWSLYKLGCLQGLVTEDTI